MCYINYLLKVNMYVQGQVNKVTTGGKFIVKLKVDKCSAVILKGP